MEPQLEGCGKVNGFKPRLTVPAASMEPQLEGCGKRGGQAEEGTTDPLQWSRNLRVAERRSSRAQRPRASGFNGAAT